MAKATRSPVLGYNHNVRYNGRIYHVQTEDSGPGHNRIFTHLFFEGTIIASMRYDYGEDVVEDHVRGAMQAQHKAILKELKQGLYDDKIRGFFGSGGQAFVDPSGEPSRVAIPPSGQPAVQPFVQSFVPPFVQPSWPSAEFKPAPGLTPMPPLPEAMAPSPEDLGFIDPGAPLGQFEGALVGGDGGFVALDLDALPPLDSDEPPLPPVIVESGSPNGTGLGFYSLRSGSRERPFPSPAEAPPGVAPAAVAASATPSPVPAPVPVPPPTPQGPPPSRPPVVLIRPPVRRPPPPQPAGGSPPPGGVVVQRTVVIGVGGSGPGGQRPRRPRPAVPYVVKEGSHPIVQNPSAAQVAPPIPPQRPNSAHNSITDKSLDEVILAYLSQDNEPKR